MSFIIPSSAVSVMSVEVSTAVGSTAGKLAPLYVGSVSFLVTKLLVMPSQGSQERFYMGLVGDKLSPWYEPSRDGTLNVMMTGAILGYVVMAGGLTLLDLVSPAAWKTQGSKSYFSAGSWLRATSVSLFNMFVCSWLVMVPVWILHRCGTLRGGSPLATTGTDDVLHPSTCLLNYIIHTLIIDVWFYSTHCALHWPVFYSLIHKKHHLFKAPNAVACMYANPVEFCIGNVLGVILGPALTNCSPVECAFWMCFSLASTSASHSGYRFMGATDHDLHHEHLYCNYGVGIFMDKLFQTEFEGSELQAKVNQRKKLADKSQ